MSVPSTGERTIGNGRYVLLREIGLGGAGVVWRGEDRVIQRPVAIKEAIMSRNLAEQQRDVTMQRMLREVRATGQLNHPAVLTIHDVIWDEESGAAYIVMELVDGSSLAETLKRTGPMRPAWAARVALDVLGALEAAHESGVVHRDVKPSNIMLPSDDDACESSGIRSRPASSCNAVGTTTGRCIPRTSRRIHRTSTEPDRRSTG